MKKGVKNVLKCIGSFLVCVFLFVGVDHAINHHLRHPLPLAAGSTAEAAV